MTSRMMTSAWEATPEQGRRPLDAQILGASRDQTLDPLRSRARGADDRDSALARVGFPETAGRSLGRGDRQGFDLAILHFKTSMGLRHRRGG